MRIMKQLCGLMLLAGTLVSGDAVADRWHGHGHGHGHSSIGLGLYFGSPYAYPYYPPYYYYPYPYYPPVIEVPSQPPVYIEKNSRDSDPEATGYWYYCKKPEGYYPYVKKCPGGWTEVEPMPPPEE